MKSRWVALSLLAIGPAVAFRLGGSGLLDAYPTLGAYIARAEARPAYQRAFADQLAVFKQSFGIDPGRSM